jgi:hypothetical protein
VLISYLLQFWKIGQMLTDRLLVLQSKCEEQAHRENIKFPDDYCDERGHRSLRDNPVWCPPQRSCSDLFAGMFDVHPVLSGNGRGRCIFANSNPEESVNVMTGWFEQLASRGYF